MAKKLYIVTSSAYIGHNPFDEEALLSDLDIRTICKSWEDANTYIDRSIACNIAANEDQVGKGVITCKVDRPDFFEGREVDAYYTDTKESKKWMHQYSIFERTMYDPRKEDSQRKLSQKMKNAIDESLDDIKHGRVTTCKSVEDMFKTLGI